MRAVITDLIPEKSQIYKVLDFPIYKPQFARWNKMNNNTAIKQKELSRELLNVQVTTSWTFRLNQVRCLGYHF